MLTAVSETICWHLLSNVMIEHVWDVLWTVYAASSNVDEVIRRTNTLSNQTSRLRQLGAEIGHNILELQRMIGEARAQAASVSIAHMMASSLAFTSNYMIFDWLN